MFYRKQVYVNLRYTAFIYNIHKKSNCVIYSYIKYKSSQNKIAKVPAFSVFPHLISDSIRMDTCHNYLYMWFKKTPKKHWTYLPFFRSIFYTTHLPSISVQRQILKTESLPIKAGLFTEPCDDSWLPLGQWKTQGNPYTRAHCLPCGGKWSYLEKEIAVKEHAMKRKM